jgi:hypothetical protein
LATADDLALLMAVALKRHEQLTREEAIKRAVEHFWVPPFKIEKSRFFKSQSLAPRGITKERFIARLYRRLRGRSLEEYERNHPAFVRYSRARSF